MGRGAVIPLLRQPQVSAKGSPRVLEKSSLRVSEKGSQTMELTMLLPLVLVMLLMFGEAARVVVYKMVLLSAAREGARVAALHAPQSEVEAVIRQSAGNLAIEQVEIVRNVLQEANTVQRTAEGTTVAGDITVKVVAVVPLKMFEQLGLPSVLSRFRMEETTSVPALE